MENPPPQVYTVPQNKYSTSSKRGGRSRIEPQPHLADDHKKNRNNRKRTRTQTETQEPAQDKLFTAITNKAITMMKIRGGRALGELKGQTREKSGHYRKPVSKQKRKIYSKGKQNGSRYRAERVVVIHEMTLEEARNTEVNTTRTGRGRYGNAHIMYDANDGLVDIILEVTPTEEQQAERNKEQKDRKIERIMAKEKEHEIREKYRPRRHGGDAHHTCI
jgi:hypothetical protein